MSELTASSLCLSVSDKLQARRWSLQPNVLRPGPRQAGGSSNEGHSVKVNGVIQSLPSGPSLIGDWMINNTVVRVTSSTKLKAEHGAFGVGTRVKAKGLKLADGSLVATKIQVAD